MTRYVVYNRLINRDCIVTIKLITKGRGGKSYSTTYLRSKENVERDNFAPDKLELKTGKNSALDQALRLELDGAVSHFQSSDLTKDPNYKTEMPNWFRYYKSMIIIPIRCVKYKKIGTPKASDDIGLLCLDTKSRNRLNNTYHVDLLAAFADQMYNFLNLMRGNYNLILKESKG